MFWKMLSWRPLARNNLSDGSSEKLNLHTVEESAMVRGTSLLSFSIMWEKHDLLYKFFICWYQNSLVTVLCPLGVRASLSKWKVRVPHFVYWGEREYKSHMKQVVVICFSTLRAESSYSPPEVLLQGIFSRPPRLKKIIYKKKHKRRKNKPETK